MKKIVLFSVCFYFPINLYADCYATCEFDCKSQCEVSIQTPIGSESYTDNFCYNGCLSKEQLCKAAIPAARTACRTSLYYQQGLITGKEIRRRGVVTSMEQCSNLNFIVTTWANREGGEVAKQISDKCGCFFCEDIMSEPITPKPTVSRHLKIYRNYKIGDSHINDMVDVWVSEGQPWKFIPTGSTEDCYMFVDVNSNAEYRSSVWSAHTDHQWVGSNFQSGGQADASSASCFVRSQPSD